MSRTLYKFSHLWKLQPPGVYILGQVCVCVDMSICVCLGVHVQMCVWKLEINLGCDSVGALHFVFQSRSLTGLGLRDEMRLAGQEAPAIHLCSAVVTSTRHHTWLFIWWWGLNSGPHLSQRVLD